MGFACLSTSLAFKKRRRPLVAPTLGLALLGGSAFAALDAKDVPCFALRARVVSADETPPQPGQRFAFRLTGAPDVRATTGDSWCPEFVFETDDVARCLKLYPNLYLKQYPVVLNMSVTPHGKQRIQVEAQLQWRADKSPSRPALDAKTEATGDDLAPPTWRTGVTMSGDLAGPTLGFLVWRDEEGRPCAATMTEYNRRYWKHLDGVAIPEEQRPRHFPIVDRFIGGDDDRPGWSEGISNLARAGFSAIMLPPKADLRERLLETGLRRTSWAVYNPPGYAFDYDPSVTEESIAAWARKQAEPYRAAGYAPEDMALFTMSDEPGWYYPVRLNELSANAAALDRFRQYLRDQGLDPPMVGAQTWDAVHPIGRSRATDLPSKRLFYWTVRFFSWDSARHFARCARAIEEVFRPNVPIVVNWNFFSGRFYFPGPFGNNPDKTHPDCAMGGHDWLEFGRMRGCTTLWTEDWFGDERAPQWSFYCSKLNSAARKGGVEFGGYVIPRTCGAREDGILQRILTIVGSGGKAVKYFVFGPEYVFPGNCYSFKSHLLPKMAEAHRMIGAAEDVLWPGRRPRAETAILHPRSSLPWDAIGQKMPTEIVDATNAAPERQTVDYMAEVFGLYTALQHANIPVDWLEEDDLTAEGLKGLRVLYVTEPDLPVEGMAGIAAWVRGGGTLVTVAGAGTHDRYHEPNDALAEATGIRQKPRKRMLVGDTRKLAVVGTARRGTESARAVGVRGESEGGEPVAAFEDGAPAIVERSVGAGRVAHFNWMPGMSYLASSQTTQARLPSGFSDALRDWITAPSRMAGVKPPVLLDRPMIEAPLLLSEEGAAITLLNWTQERQERVRVSARLPFAAASIRAVKAGDLDFTPSPEGVAFQLPLGAADIVVIRPAKANP